MGAIELDPEQQAEMQEQLLDFAQCMRDHGIDMADPVFGEDGRVEIRRTAPNSGADPAMTTTSRPPRRSANEDGGMFGPGSGARDRADPSGEDE